MKKINKMLFISLVMLFGLMFNNSFVNAASIVTTTTSHVSTVHIPMVPPCYGPANDCTEIVTTTTINPHIVSHGTYNTLDLQIGSIDTYYDLQGAGTNSTIASSPGNYTFPSTSTIKIVQCDTNPSYNGLVLSITGLTTDGTGNLSVYIP